jgi:hypothetical protein
MTTKMSRRSILARAPAAAAIAALPVAASDAGVPADPIFAVIAEHRAAQEDLYKSFAANELDTEDDPNKQRAADREDGTWLPLFVTEPTTVAGVAALLEYVGSDAHEQWQDYRDDGLIYTVLSYASELTHGLGEATRTFPRRIGATLRSLIATA